MEYQFLLFIIAYTLLYSSTNAIDIRQNHAWCPPNSFVQQRKSTRRYTRTAIISEIHGELKPAHWGTLLPGNLLARNMHHHLGVMGFDKMYLNYIYNDTQHPVPPTIEEMYPPSLSCVSAWYKTGVIEIRYIPYAGPVERWPVHPDTGLPSLEKDLYKTNRGINPAYAEIKKRNETDWVMILDIDEYLWPMNWKTTRSDWCSSEYPSILEIALQQMQIVATTTALHNFRIMEENKNNIRPHAEACMIGYGVSTGHGPKCRPIGSIVMPVRFWTKFRGIQTDGAKNHMPQLRSKVYASYDIVQQLNLTTNNEDNQYQRWKSIHQTKFTPFLEGRSSMHYGQGDNFDIIAPREFHNGGVTLEIGHIKKHCGKECLSVLVRDDVLDNLAKSYIRCMSNL